jgi:RHS repeat-associated protein
MEKDGEVNGTDNTYTTHFRMLDTRLGRWWGTDPVVHEWQSPYTTFDNNPILFIDPSGADGEYTHDDEGNTTGYQGDVIDSDGNTKMVAGDQWDNDALKTAGYTPQPLQDEKSPYAAYKRNLEQIDVSSNKNTSGGLFNGYIIQPSDLQQLADISGASPSTSKRIIRDFQNGNIYPLTAGNESRWWNCEQCQRMYMFAHTAVPGYTGAGASMPITRVTSVRGSFAARSSASYGSSTNFTGEAQSFVGAEPNQVRAHFKNQGWQEGTTSNGLGWKFVQPGTKGSTTVYFQPGTQGGTNMPGIKTGPYLRGSYFNGTRIPLKGNPTLD